MLDPKIVFHFAMADNCVIGKDNDMPWHVATDLKRFKELTWGKPLIMGRRTFESIGRPLPGRKNNVLTRDTSYLSSGVSVLNSIEDALSSASRQAYDDGVDEIAVIGGGAIYGALWGVASRLYVTHVHARPEGDTFLPSIEDSDWEKIYEKSADRGVNDSANMTFAIYDRRVANRIGHAA
ncbi:dihydrofolate reductase [Cohaesibacter haloalkalitolerans]|uniref:dihydrofolate reductase n=1 Tax=Cohaesibacter haloalkalitolerans TaxID=1162980 RepID=UPI000E65CC39|nr:dihydrofolate reductase [Cohaesibacter haloalkalitolerans]